MHNLTAQDHRPSGWGRDGPVPGHVDRQRTQQTPPTSSADRPDPLVLGALAAYRTGGAGCRCSALAGRTVQTGTTVNASGGGTLDNVTLAGTLNVNSFNVDVAGTGLTLANGTINVGGYFEFHRHTDAGSGPGRQRHRDHDQRQR